MTSAEAVQDPAAWIVARLPKEWLDDVPEVTVDREEILVIVPIEPPENDGPGAFEGRIALFREESRAQRMRIADEAQQKFGRIVSWGASVFETTVLFTTASVPVMTRLRQRDRMVLDTLVESGVARSRSEALAWCVRLVGQHQEEWIASLREALVAVEEARRRGPGV